MKFRFASTLRKICTYYCLILTLADLTFGWSQHKNTWRLSQFLLKLYHRNLSFLFDGFCSFIKKGLERKSGLRVRNFLKKLILTLGTKLLHVFLIYVTNNEQNNEKASFFFNHLYYPLDLDFTEGTIGSLRQLLQAGFTNRVMSAWLENYVSDIHVAEGAVAVVSLGLTSCLLYLK